jgi:ER membrane protein complex subunit 8/9
MSQPKFTISSRAYAKIILHSGKYPASSLLGLLIGRREAEGSIVIDDVVPLLHKWTTLSPIAEVGCALVSATAAQAIICACD